MSKLRATLPFVASSSFSLLGNSIAGVVLPLVLLARTGDALAAGTLAIICAIPQVLAGVLGGALLDRFNRRDLSIVSDLISAASIAALPIIDATVGLSFGWFVVCGIVGAVGDIPGMTARDTLLPAVIEHDKLDLQRFMGVAQSIDNLVVIVGPAIASMGMGFLGASNTLWLTAALSFVAAMTTLFVPRAVGFPPKTERTQGAGLVRTAVQSTKEGMRVLFKSDAVLRASVVLGMLIVIVMGSYQGMVLPVFFTQENAPTLLGYVLSAMSVGALVGSLGYAKFAYAMKRHTWYVVSFVGMAIGVAALGSFASYGVILAGAAMLGLFSGPVSALFGYFVYGLIPDEHRGAALGTQNSMLLVVAPIAVFATSIVIEVIGVGMTSFVLAFGWILLTVYALAMKAMREI
ncbi:MFS transporter [Slackia piriformis]|uniref:MFS transporter n=1 Tax=Slackia piriformis TaxID=626934 RepID=UPI0026DB14EA|nr:MFS transporter [Slackia piriformis]MDO5023261.1 MFS transporter [Slackia piriformis]